MRRFLVRSAFLAACLATLVSVLFLEERIRGSLSWRSYAAEARQRGVKLDFAEFIPPRVPETENFASIPLFAEAFQAEQNQQGYTCPLILPPPPADPANILAKRVLPALSDPGQQISIDLHAWQKYFVEVKLLPEAGPNAAADTLKALEKYGPYLAQLHEAGSRPRCQFPVHWERGFEAGLPHMVIFQSAAKLFALRMAAHLHLGQSAEAYQDFRDGLNLITATAKEPTLISGLVRISCLPVLCGMVWNGLATHQWGEPELRKIESDLVTLDWLEDCIFSLSSERGGLNFMIDVMIDDSAQLAKIMPIVRSMNETPPTLPRWGWSLYPTGWLYQNKLRTNRFFDECLARIEPGERRWFPERPVPSSPTNITNPAEKAYYLFFAIGAPAFEGIEKRFVWAATFTQQARMACALERYRQAHGHFPEALAALSPAYLSTIPVEVVNGQPYHYRPTPDGGFELYSVAINGRDDGGQAGPEKSSVKHLDWMWKASGAQ